MLWYHGTKINAKNHNKRISVKKMIEHSNNYLRDRITYFSSKLNKSSVQLENMIYLYYTINKKLMQKIKNVVDTTKPMV